MKTLIAAMLFLSPQIYAQNRVRHYISHHKRLIAQGSLTMLAGAAVTESSIHCQRVSRGCNETNTDIGRHPSDTTTRLYGYGSRGLIVSGTFLIDYLLHRYHEEDLWPLEHLANIPINIMDALSTRNNVQAAEYLQRQSHARERLR